ncbi:Hypothetical predicted protein [Marmota monax]|uniref:Uncharacterized protein n=1 Tax=Marmota monax TaxID=9995 RepID=A0A5E4ATT3_MARMO|nr:Hypothetical predicted protein [Marmota monax]
MDPAEKDLIPSVWKKGGAQEEVTSYCHEGRRGGSTARLYVKRPEEKDWKTSLTGRHLKITDPIKGLLAVPRRVTPSQSTLALSSSLPEKPA